MQAERGHEVTLATPDHGDRSVPRREERDGYEVRRHRQVVRPFDNSITPGMVSGLWRLAEDHSGNSAKAHRLSPWEKARKLAVTPNRT
jgi:hypothetical protein